MPINFLPLGGGCWGFLEGGVEVPILFLWAWGFSDLQPSSEDLERSTFGR